MLTAQLIILLVPTALLLAIGLQRSANLFRFVMATLAFALGIGFIWLAMPWDVVSVYWRMAVPVLLVLAVISGFRRIGTHRSEMPRWQVVMNLLINLALIAFFGLANLGAIAGYSRPAGAIELASPLPVGQFVVGQGGASPLVNGHFRVAPQNYALDIVGVNRWGARFRPFADREVLENYAIFGAPVHAPCAGEVLAAVDGFEDLVPPATDRVNLAGNHVVIACHGAEIVLAHLQKGSVAVAVGQQVATGDPLGRVGNSGNTSEPHLHLHAETGGEAGVILDGEAVPMLVDGRWLARNGRLEGRE